MAIAVGQFTVFDYNDIVVSDTEPSNPVEGLVWLDTSGDPPHLFYEYTGGAWKPTFFDSLKELDPDQWTKVQESYQKITDLDMDSKITRYERSVIRGEIANITGKYLSGTDSMPTLTQIDNDGVGTLYTVRENARDLGVPTTDNTYKALGDAYNALRTYLSGLNPKAWDIDSTGVITVDSAVYDSKWKDYYYAYNALVVVNNVKEKQYAENAASDAAGEAKADAIAAVNNADQYKSTALNNPTIIDAPIATLALPTFQGKHKYESTSLEFDGTNGYAEVEDNLLGTNGVGTGDVPYSLEAWVYLNKYPGVGTGAGSIIGHSSSLGFGLQIANDRVNFGYRSNSNATSNQSLALSKWYHIAAVRNVGGGGTLYIDGEKDSDFTNDISIGDTAAAIQIGWASGRMAHLPGRVKNVRVWSKSLTQSEVQSNMNSDLQGTETGLVGCWSIDEGLGNTIQDSVANNTGTLYDGYEWYKGLVEAIEDPVFSSGTTMELSGKFHGNETDSDSFYFDSGGNAVKEKHWNDVKIDGSYDWTFGTDYAGAKQVKAEGFSAALPVNTTVLGVKYNGSLLTTIASGMTVADQIVLREDNILFISVADIDSGWGEDYQPTPDEIKAYFNGWKMCNGTIDTPYTGTGNKVWYPIGDTNLDRSTMNNDDSGTSYGSVPQDMSPAQSGSQINKYQIVYRIQTPLQVEVSYEGIIELVQGSNQIDISYPVNELTITEGTYKYATNLATATGDVRHLIPTLQRKLSSAEQKITDDSIISTVLESTAYEVSLQGKANVEDLGDLATHEEVDELSEDVDERISNAIDNINFEPYVTQSQLEQTTTDITAKFQATGGMNLVHNSIGFADLDFWTGSYRSPSSVKTISNNELDTLGFGSGFHYIADGVNKGINQVIGVNAGQPYTLSWYLKKMTKGINSSYRFYIQVEEDGVITDQIADNSGEVTNGYETKYFTFTPQTNEITVRFIGYANVEAILTGIMLNIGDVPLQWSLATGELYNTNIRLDINGIRVSQFDDDRNEIAYTAITPKEFAGYFDADGNGSFEKIFYLNGEETVTKKLRAKKEIIMGSVKIINLDSGGYNGWALIPNSE